MCRGGASHGEVCLPGVYEAVLLSHLQSLCLEVTCEQRLFKFIFLLQQRMEKELACVCVCVFLLESFLLMCTRALSPLDLFETYR